MDTCLKLRFQVRAEFSIFSRWTWQQPFSIKPCIFLLSEGQTFKMQCNINLLRWIYFCSVEPPTRWRQSSSQTEMSRQFPGKTLFGKCHLNPHWGKQHHHHVPDLNRMGQETIIYPGCCKRRLERPVRHKEGVETWQSLHLRWKDGYPTH